MFSLGHNFALPEEAVTKKLAVVGLSGTGKTHVATLLAELMLEAEYQTVVLDPVGVWWGLRLLADGSPSPFKIPVFGGLHGDLPLEPGAGALLAEVVVTHGTSAVLDVSMFKPDDACRFVADFACALFQLKKTRRSPLHLFVDEAQDFIPENPKSKEENRVLGEMVRLIKQGRVVGIGTTLITQQPQSASKRAMNQSELLIALQLGGSHERDAVRKWISSGRKSKADSPIDHLHELGRGEAVVWSPAWLKILDRIQIGPKRTANVSATPVRGEKSSTASLPPLDTVRLRSAIGELAQRAEENDPAKLKKRIAELEQQRKPGGTNSDDVVALRRQLEHAERDAQEYQRCLRVANEQLDNVRGRLSHFHSRALADAALIDQLQREIAEPSVREENESARKLKDTKAVATFATDDMVREIAAGDALEEALREERTVAVREIGARMERELGIDSTYPAGVRESRPHAPKNKPAGGVQSALLGTLAAWHPKTLSKIQLSLQSMYSHRSSAFDSALKRLRDAGHITSEGGRYGATAAGLKAAAVSPMSPRSPAEAIAAWRGKLSTGVTLALFDAIISFGGPGLTKADLAKRSGYSATSSAFDGALKLLRDLALIEVDRQTKKYRPHPDLYLWTGKAEVVNGR